MYLFITGSHISLSRSNEFMFGLSLSQQMLHVYVITHVFTFLLKMVKAALCEVFRGTELETTKAARSGRKDLKTKLENYG